MSATLSTRSRARHEVLALLTVATMVNYLDRTVLGIAAPALTADLDLSPAVMGIVFSNSFGSNVTVGATGR